MGHPFGADDVDHHRAAVGVEQVVRNVAAELTVHLGTQREWLGHNAMHRRIEIGQQQVRQLQP